MCDKENPGVNRFEIKTEGISQQSIKKRSYTRENQKLNQARAI
jgi:hypothetical protein